MSNIVAVYRLLLSRFEKSFPVTLNYIAPEVSSFRMKRIVHHGYAIKAIARNGGGTWRPHVSISLAQGPRMVELQDESRFTTKDEAEHDGLAIGTHWVNNRLQRMQKSH